MPRTCSVPSTQQGGSHQAKSASPKGSAKSGTVGQHQVSGTSGQQDGASNGSSEFSELENKEASKRPLPKKSSAVLRRVQSESHGSPCSLPSLVLGDCLLHCVTSICLSTCNLPELQVAKRCITAAAFVEDSTGNDAVYSAVDELIDVSGYLPA